MTVFKTFWKIVNKYKGTIIGYTVLLLVFGTLSMSSSDVTEDFKSSKPDVIIVDNDKSVLSNNLVKYFNDNANILDIDLEEEKIDDAIFYRDANYVIYIDEGYEDDVLNGNNPEINIKSSGDYSSSLAEMLLKRYLKTQDVLHDEFSDKSILVNKINDSLKTNANVELATKINTTELTRLSRYYNFASYSIIAVVMFIICLVLSSFNEESVKKRTIISSMNYKKYNKCIMLSSILYVLFVVILYTILGYFVFGSIMFSKRGLIYILNTFIFAVVALALSLLVSTLVNKKEAVSGIVNVVALSQAFLCGAFISVMWLPDSVLKLAHVFPAYYYINSNELLASLEVLSFSNLKLIFINMGVMILFIVIFIILNNIFSKKKQVLR